MLQRQPSGQWLPVADAAEVLQTTTDALRARIKRDRKRPKPQIQTQRVGGRVLVFIPDAPEDRQAITIRPEDLPDIALPEAADLVDLPENYRRLIMSMVDVIRDQASQLGELRNEVRGLRRDVAGLNHTIRVLSRPAEIAE